MTSQSLSRTSNSSDGRVVRASGSRDVDSGLIPSRVKPMVKIRIHSFLV